MPESPRDDRAPFPLSDRPQDRQIWLDVLRAIAILLVASGHMAAAFAIPRDIATFARPLFAALIQLAVAGVDIFLVLSGFLIGGMLISELRDTGTIDLLRFYTRRALRLWPPYFLAVLFAWQWYRINPYINEHRVAPPSLADMWPFFLQVQNYYDIHVHHKLNIGAVMQTWTLVLLIHFYLLAPLLILALRKLSGPRLPALPYVVGAMFIACFVMRYRAAPATQNDYDAWKHYFPTHLRLDEPLAGMLAAWWAIHFRDRLTKLIQSTWPILLLVGVATFLPVALRLEEGPPFLVIWGYTLAGVGCVPLILVAWHFSSSNASRAPAAPVRWFSRIGLWSYSIYLWHQPTAQLLAYKVRARIFSAMTRLHSDPWHSRFQYLMSALIYFTIAISIGVVMYYLTERPTLLLRDRLLARRRSPATPPQPALAPTSAAQPPPPTRAARFVA
jgi:peptidoglycan/LPS O-acetylase OafA/YrhL